MRSTLAILMLAFPAPAMAQAPAPGTPPVRGAISRDQFIQRATNRAGQVFDSVDVNHTGYITQDQLRAWRQSHGPQQR